MITVPYIMWFLTHTDPQHPGRVVAYAMQASHSGGHRLPGEHVGDTIEEVRAMLPAGLTRQGCGDASLEGLSLLGRQVSFRWLPVWTSTGVAGGFIISIRFDASSMSASASAVNCAIISEWRLVGLPLRSNRSP
ncbi:MAG: hypothetical protein ACRYF2_26615 [Janthinobacterium lividum]